MRGGSPLTVAGAAAELEARFGSLLTAFPFDPQARFTPAENQSKSIMRKVPSRASGFATAGSYPAAFFAEPLPLPLLRMPSLIAVAG
jgi:hypothetical protein